MIFDKKGQGMSLNVIIVAAIALVILVVLIAIFTGKIGTFQEGVNKEGQAELIKLRITYGKCQPNDVAEQQFMTEYSSAANVEAEAQAKTTFKQTITRCNDFSNDQNVCSSEGGCTWS